jgi:hypothetical protein
MVKQKLRWTALWFRDRAVVVVTALLWFGMRI